MTPTKTTKPRAATRGNVQSKKISTGFPTSDPKGTAHEGLDWAALVKLEPRLQDLADVCRYQRATDAVLRRAGRSGHEEAWDKIKCELVTLVGIDRGRPMQDRVTLSRESTHADWQRLVTAAKDEQAAAAPAEGDEAVLRTPLARGVADRYLEALIRGDVP